MDNYLSPEEKLFLGAEFQKQQKKRPSFNGYVAEAEQALRLSITKIRKAHDLLEKQIEQGYGNICAFHEFANIKHLLYDADEKLNALRRANPDLWKR